MNSKNEHLQTLYPIESFGIRQISLSGIRVESLASRLVPNVPFPHKHSFYQIVVINKGRGSHQIDFTNHRVTKEHIFIMKPGQVHSWDFPEDVQGIVIDFSIQSIDHAQQSNLDKWNEINSLPDSLTVKNKKKFQEIASFAEIMFKEFQKQELYYNHLLKNLLSSLIIKILRLDESSQKRSFKGGSLLVNQFNALVEENFKGEHGVSFYAEKLGQPPKTMSMAITRATGLSPRHIIHERLLLEAKRLLAFSSKSIADISYELGFDDYSYFIRFFKKHTLQTPAVYRKSL